MLSSQHRKYFLKEIKKEQRLRNEVNKDAINYILTFVLPIFLKTFANWFPFSCSLATPLAVCGNWYHRSQRCHHWHPVRHIPANANPNALPSPAVGLIQQCITSFALDGDLADTSYRKNLWHWRLKKHYPTLSSVLLNPINPEKAVTLAFSPAG